MLFDIPFFADRNKTVEYWKHQTNLNVEQEDCFVIGILKLVRVLLRKDGILRKSERWYERDTWTITLVNTNETIRVHCRIKSEEFNTRRVTAFFNTVINVVFSDISLFNKTRMLTYTMNRCFSSISSLIMDKNIPRRGFSTHHLIPHSWG